MAHLKKELAKLVARERVCRVATVGHGGVPHLVPVCHVLVDGKICFASGRNAKKVQNLRANDHVTVTVDAAAAGGFAVNVDPRESRRERLAAGDVAAGFTAESYVKFATSLAGLERRVENVGGSVDLYPYLIVMLFVIFLGEAVYANRV